MIVQQLFRRQVTSVWLDGKPAVRMPTAIHYNVNLPRMSTRQQRHIMWLFCTSEYRKTQAKGPAKPDDWGNRLSEEELREIDATVATVDELSVINSQVRDTLKPNKLLVVASVLGWGAESNQFVLEYWWSTLKPDLARLSIYIDV